MAKRRRGRTAARSVSLTRYIPQPPAPRPTVVVEPIVMSGGRGGAIARRAPRRSGGSVGGRVERVVGLSVGGALGRTMAGALATMGLSPTASKVATAIGGYMLAGRSRGGIASAVGDGAIATAGADLLGSVVTAVGNAAKGATGA